MEKLSLEFKNQGDTDWEGSTKWNATTGNQIIGKINELIDKNLEKEIKIIYNNPSGGKDIGIKSNGLYYVSTEEGAGFIFITNYPKPVTPSSENAFIYGNLTLYDRGTVIQATGKNIQYPRIFKIYQL